jgi:hypothetical protein
MKLARRLIDLLKMATLKTLEKALVTLAGRVDALEYTSEADVHYVASDAEYGESAININTLRFVFNENDRRTYNAVGEHRSICDKKFKYTLINTIRHLIPGHATALGVGTVVIYSDKKMDEFRDDGIDDEDVIAYNCQSHNYTTMLCSDKQIIEHLEKYNFVARTERNKHGESPPVYFKERVKINFKKKYKIMPHVTFYVTPFVDNFLDDVKIVELNKFHCVIEVSYGEAIKGGYFSEELMLHWRVSGVIEESARDLLLPEFAPLNTNVTNDIVFRNEVLFKSQNPFDLF